MAIVEWYRRNLPHIQVEANPHLVTFCTRKRWTLPLLSRDIVMNCCLYEHTRRANIRALVVMPDHVHLVLIPFENQRMVAIIASIKSSSSHLVNQKLHRKGSLWQEESFDHSIRSDEYLNAKMAYVLNNPVRKGLVKSAREYQWVWTADPEFMSKFLFE